LTGNILIAYFDINPAEFHLANPGNCLNNRGHLCLDRRHHVHRYGRRLAVPGNRSRPVQPRGRRLVDQATHER